MSYQVKFDIEALEGTVLNYDRLHSDMQSLPMFRELNCVLNTDTSLSYIEFDETIVPPSQLDLLITSLKTNIVKGRLDVIISDDTPACSKKTITPEGIQEFRGVIVWRPINLNR